MQTTFVVRNLTSETLAALEASAPADAHAKLTRWAFGDLKHCVSVKYGSGQFRDRVEWNGVMRDVSEGRRNLAFKAEPRRGYRLFTFTAEA